MSQPHVIIAGAGIAGLTAAIAFARRGVAVTLVEKRTSFEEVGAGLQISPNASRVLIQLGVPGLIRTAVEPARLYLRNWHEPRAFATMPMGEAAGRYGAPFWVFRRSDLQIALVDAVRGLPRIKLLVDRRITAAATVNGRVEVTLTTGRGRQEQLSGSLLVAADGLWSTLRSHMRESPDAMHTGYEAWRTLIPAEKAPAFMREPNVALWFGPDRHAVHYPVAAGRQINLVLVRRAKQAPAMEDNWSLPPDEAEVARLADRAATPLRHLIGAGSDWRRWPLFDRPPSPMARQGERMALIGDAAHPMLPFMAQGAAMGIEDAAELAAMITPALLAQEDGALDAALQRFDALRRPRATRMYQRSRSNGRSAHLKRPWSWARDLAIRQLGPEGMLNRHDWIYGWTGED